MARPRDEAKVNKIFEAALKAVLREGFVGLKMKSVAEASGLAMGTLYIYFRDKENLIDALFIRLKSEKTQRLLSVYGASDPFPVAFRKIWLKYLDISLEEPEQMMFIEQFARSPYLSESAKAVSAELIRPIESLLQRGVDEYFLVDLPPPVLISQLTGPVFELVKLQLDGQVRLSDDLRERCFQMTWNAVRR